MTTATRTRPAELTLAHFAAQVPAMAGGNSPWASRYARELREVAVRAQHRSPRSTQRELGPSEIGHICHRLVVGKMAGQPITNHVVDPWPSIVGTAVHAWLATAFERENEINGVIRWLTERRVAADPRYPGTADLYDGYELALVDHKVLGPTTMARVQSAAGPAWRAAAGTAPARSSADLHASAGDRIAGRLRDLLRCRPQVERLAAEPPAVCVADRVGPPTG